jgi:hypothetical protein
MTISLSKEFRRLLTGIFVWITVKVWTLERLVVYDNLALKQLLEVKKNIKSLGNLCINLKHL